MDQDATDIIFNVVKKRQKTRPDRIMSHDPAPILFALFPIDYNNADQSGNAACAELSVASAVP
jgi:hypothetical protein